MENLKKLHAEVLALRNIANNVLAKLEREMFSETARSASSAKRVRREASVQADLITRITTRKS